MSIIWFACLALHFSQLKGDLPYSTTDVDKRYDITEGECSPIQLDENLLQSITPIYFDECATFCDEFAECQWFQWNRGANLCQTYNSICTKNSSANFNYLCTKKAKTASKVIFSSTYFLRMFGACESNNNSLLTNMSLSTTIEDCANECAKYPRCQYVSFSNESLPNCKIGLKFCDNPADRIERGNNQWQLLKRISGAPIGYVPKVTVIRYDGTPTNDSLKTSVSEAEECVVECIETSGCVASVYAQFATEMNCLLVNQTFDPIDISHSANKSWQTHIVTSDYRDMNLTTLNGTEFIWKSDSDFSGTLLKTISLSSESDCAAKCANKTDCVAFKFTNVKLTNNGSCELYTNWQHIRKGNASVFLRLSFPFEHNRTRFIRHRYDDGMNDIIVMRDGQSFAECERLCSRFPECTSFLFIHPEPRLFDFNCFPQANHSGNGPIQVYRLLLDGWNTFTYANHPMKDTDHYEKYNVHGGYCFDTARTTSKSMNVSQDECRLMCDELVQCMGFVVKYDYSADSVSCALTYSKCDSVDEPNGRGIYSFEKKSKERSQYMFNQTIYIKWLGDCKSADNNHLLQINVSSIADCAEECSERARCEYFSWSSRHDYNCVVGKKFCFRTNDRIYRGDVNRQLFQRISHKSFDHIDNRVVVRFNGICDEKITSDLAGWISTTTASVDRCGIECTKMNCTAYSTTRSPAEWGSWFVNQYDHTSCLLRGKMCDPFDLRRSEDPDWETYQITVNLKGLERVVLGESEFLKDFRGAYSGVTLKRVNTSNAQKCADNCSRDSQCEAFSFLTNATSSTNCETFTYLTPSGNGSTPKFLRLSFPVKVAGLQVTLYKYECGNTTTSSTSKSLVACAQLCVQNPDCVAYVYTDSEMIFGKSIGNCALKPRMCGTTDNIVRLMLPGWNTYVLNNWPPNPAENYIVQNNNNSSYTGELKNLNGCARSCDDKPSCRGFNESCSLIYCQPTVDSECLSDQNGSVFMKNNTGAQIITWSNRQFIHWNADCRRAADKSLITTDWQRCLRECFYEQPLCKAAVYKADENPDCYMYFWSCQKLHVNNPSWHMYKMVSTGIEVFGEKMIHTGEDSYEQFVQSNVDILDLQLSSVIADFNGNHYNKYVFTEYECYKKCQADPLCLAMSYNRAGAETAELCQLYDELQQLVVQTEPNWGGQLRRSFDTWVSTNLQSGFVKSRGLCKEYSTPLQGYTLMQCAKHCATMQSCRDIAMVNNECRINTKTCYQGVQKNDEGDAYSKVLFKAIAGREFAEGHFALSRKLCADKQVMKSVVSETECARLCTLNENCSSFVWNSNTNNECYIQSPSCTTGNETKANFNVYRKLTFIADGVKMTASGNFSSTEESEFQSNSIVYGIAITAAFVVVTGGLIVLMIIVCRKSKQLKELAYLDRDLNDPSKEIDPIVPVFEQLENLKLDKKFELPLDRIDVDRKHLKTLGMGNFGRVVLGNYKLPDGKSVSVAIKRTRSSWDAEQYRMLFKEICLMANIGKHPNLVNLVGAVTQIAKGHLYLVMDYCSNGSLREFIIKSVEENQFHNEIVSNGSEESYAIKPDGNNQLCTSDLLSFAFQIASGMEYVASVKLVHRDLAARNVLLTSDLIAKISDFGLGRQEYQFYETDKTVLLPIRWTSPEALLLHKFSTRSDVWSFGITLGEIFSLGTVPFANVSKFDRTFAEDLKEGRLIVPKPQYSPERVYKLINHCCMPDPKNRVSFAQCKNLLQDEFRFCNAAKFEQLIERLLVTQKSFPNEENPEMSTDPATSATESPSKRQNFFGRFLAQKPSPSQKGLEDLMLKEFKRETVELNTYQ